MPAMEEGVCPICSEAKATIYLDGEEGDLTEAAIGPSRTRLSYGRILRCSVCRFGFRRFRPTDNQLATLYRATDDHLYEKENTGRIRTARTHARIVGRYQRSGRLLDVGCASGAFLSVMADRGWDVEGVEPSQQQAARSQSLLAGRGRIQHCNLQQAQFGSAFDVITLWDVLEHVAEPVEFLKRCASLLQGSGFLFLNVPDLDSLQARILNHRWPLLLPEHLNYFNKGSLMRCAEKAGCEWLAGGKRPAYFSLHYVLYRLSQHLPLAGTISRVVEATPAKRLTIPVWMGERYAILKKRG
jgi:SAM-dependent methyltransferase